MPGIVGRDANKKTFSLAVHSRAQAMGTRGCAILESQNNIVNAQPGAARSKPFNTCPRTHRARPAGLASEPDFDGVFDVLRRPEVEPPGLDVADQGLGQLEVADVSGGDENPLIAAEPGLLAALPPAFNLEVDAADREHFAALVQGARDGDALIGRMAVDLQWRRKGVGGAILKFLEDFARTQGLTRSVLHAQEYVKSFYAAHGYQQHGGSFLEVDIPHVEMRKEL